MNVVGYVRLSRDEDRENYSSILAQQDIIKEYAQKRGWKVSKFYIDDNYSGYTLNRPQLNELLEEVNKGNIDVIIAKDLSRIGRNNGKVLVLIDEFKELNIRLILVNESSGGFDILKDNDDILGIKTWYNEMYVKDISRKIRSSMSTKQKNGELIMGNYYGYKKTKVNDKFILTVDEEIRPVIQLIFKYYISGMGYKKICDLLEESGYPTPSEYIKKRFEDNGRVFKNAVSDKWQTHMIERIIKDDIYIGNLRIRKMHSRLIKGKQRKVAKDKQLVFENHHEAIISKEDFEVAQSIKNKRRDVHYRVRSDYNNYIFSGFIKCGDCGRAALGKKLKTKPVVQHGYECGAYQKYGLKHCKSHSIPEDKVLFFFKEFLKDVKTEYEDYIKNVNIEVKKNNTKASLEKIKRELSILNDELKLLINQKIKDVAKETSIEYRQIIENSYSELEKEKKKKIKELMDQIDKLEKINDDEIEKNIRSTIDIFDKIINKERPDRKLLELILDKIIINIDKSLQFKLLVNIDKLTYADI